MRCCNLDFLSDWDVKIPCWEVLYQMQGGSVGSYIMSGLFAYLAYSDSRLLYCVQANLRSTPKTSFPVITYRRRIDKNRVGSGLYFLLHDKLRKGNLHLLDSVGYATLTWEVSR